jgi:HNH endonuclease
MQSASDFASPSPRRLLNASSRVRMRNNRRGPQHRFSHADRYHLFVRAGGRCQQCRTPLNSIWHADHVIPVTEGGSTEIGNGQALCACCNYSKSARNCRLVDAPLRRVAFTEPTIPEIHDGVQRWVAVDVLECNHVVVGRRGRQSRRCRACAVTHPLSSNPDVK